jgi:hypothetical protein
MDLRQLHKEELNDMYSSPNIFQAVKSRKMSWEWHTARMKEKCTQVFGGKI